MEKDYEKVLKEWENFSLYVNSYIEKEKPQIKDIEIKIENSLNHLKNEIKNLERKQIDFEKLKDSILKNTDNFIKLEKEYSEKIIGYQDKLNSFLKNYAEKEKEAKKNYEDAQNANSDFISMMQDYVCPHTSKYLFEKYHKIQPVIIRKICSTMTKENKVMPPSNDNECFYVMEINKEFASCLAFENGKKVGAQKVSIKVPVFALYKNDEYINKILEQIKETK